jgi:ribosome-binding factor A
MKHRLQRVNELIKRELGELIVRQCKFPAKLVTIQEVDITPDLKHAHVFISIIGLEAEQHASMAILHDKRKTLQGLLAKRVILKFTPQLHFKLDTTAARGDRILNILSDLNLPEEQPTEDDDYYPDEGK